MGCGERHHDIFTRAPARGHFPAPSNKDASRSPFVFRSGPRALVRNRDIFSKKKERSSNSLTASVLFFPFLVPFYSALTQSRASAEEIYGRGASFHARLCDGTDKARRRGPRLGTPSPSAASILLFPLWRGPVSRPHPSIFETRSTDKRDVHTDINTYVPCVTAPINCHGVARCQDQGLGGRRS